MLASLKAILSASVTTAVTVCVTIVVTLWLNGPTDGPNPNVEMKWLELPKLEYSIGEIRNLESANSSLEKLFGTDRLPPILNDMRYGRSVLVELDITNKSSRRTKALEVVGEKINIAALSETWSGGEKTIVWKEPGPIRVRPLAPGERARVIVLLQSVTSMNWDPPLRVLHDGALVRPLYTTLRDRDDIFGVVPLFVRVAPFGEMYLLFSAAVIIFFVVFGFWWNANKRNFPIMVKTTGDAELARMAELVDYVRKEFPEKLPLALRRGADLPEAPRSSNDGQRPTPAETPRQSPPSAG